MSDIYREGVLGYQNTVSDANRSGDQQSAPAQENMASSADNHISITDINWVPFVHQVTRAGRNKKRKTMCDSLKKS
jgi:hypothetical protein